jgi:glutamine synthetase type III
VSLSRFWRIRRRQKFKTIGKNQKRKRPVAGRTSFGEAQEPVYFGEQSEVANSFISDNEDLYKISTYFRSRSQNEMAMNQSEVVGLTE